MALRLTLLGAAAAVALGGCEARIGNDAPTVAENASAEGRAEEGRLTVEAPGFNLSIAIPEGVRPDVDQQDGLIYPGSTMGGIHVQGRPDQGSGEGDGEVELRFSSGDAIDRVAAWYRDPARREDLTIEAQAPEGRGLRLSGTAGRDGSRFTLRLAPREGGGTEGRLLLSDRN